MDEERMKILEMLADGTINSDDAAKLLDAISVAEEQPSISSEKKKRPKYLRVQVNDEDSNVNIRVPMMLVRAGLKMTKVMPNSAKIALEEEGIELDFSDLNADEILQAIEEFEIDVNEGKEQKVRIFTE